MPNISVSILTLKETMVYTLAGPYDIFSSAAFCSEELSTSRPLFIATTQLVGIEKGPISCYNGLKIHCQQALDEVEKTDLIIIPSLDLPQNPLLDHYPSLKKWLQDHHKNGTTIASICAGSFLLAEAGLLDGKVATTHWAFADKMQNLFPNIEIHSDKIITEQDNIICSGGATSWQDLVSYLIHKFASKEIAHQIDHYFLLNTHIEGQLPYKKLTSTIKHQDAVIQKTQEWIKENIAHTDLLNQGVLFSGLPERTFKRRFKIATGQSPNHYIQNTRIDQAKYLLETSTENIQSIAEKVGLSDGSYFRRLFKRKTEITAHDYRKQFSGFKSSKKILFR